MSNTSVSHKNTPPTKWVYLFSAAHSDGSGAMKDLLGGKGANLAEMAHLGLPVPPGFTVTTEMCNEYYKNGKQLPADLTTQIMDGIKHIEKNVGAVFGSTQNPLLVSVRSGARVSMPGMMDTVLNLGLNDDTVQALAEHSGDARFAYDSYRRFIQMYANVVLGLDHHDFEDILDTYKRDHDLDEDTDIDAEGWQDIIADYKDLVAREHDAPFPQDVHAQLNGAISAVFDSWMNNRAITYRKINAIPPEWGTAVTVQAMVFGNMGQKCATGVAFTRNPSTGVNEFYGEFLINAQGEDVVAGIRTPQHLTIKGKKDHGSSLPSMEEAMPHVFKQLCDIRTRLETHYKDMQDIEFTVQNDILYMLQTRTGKRTAEAALKIAVDMVNEGVISKQEAIMRVDPHALDQLLHPTLDPKAVKHILTKGLPASPGAACGMLVFTADDAEKYAGEGKKVILARTETSPEDIHGMHAANGILTSRGGMTSHAAVVARGMGRCCVAGAGAIVINAKEKTLTVDGLTLKQDDIITLDGSKGDVINGEIATVKPQLSGDFATLMAWADETRRMKVRANAETPTDAQTALDFGAQGIGLCRTEHMFFDPNRILNVRAMIMANDNAAREQALSALEPEQYKDFLALFTIMAGLPVTVRLLDPPLHEFLPHHEHEIQELSTHTGLSVNAIQTRMAQLHESNPMLGHRGCRLGVSFPQIYDMQVRALFKAALEAEKQTGNAPFVEVMVPLVSVSKELETIKKRIDAIAKDTAPSVNYLVGTMIELPRAALTADEIAHSAHFFSFGTNDLTQTTFGISRDDAGSFLPDYQRHGLMMHDPFVRLDQDGVGQLIEIAYNKGRAMRPDIKTGICGEHGGDPSSIEFCEKVGLDYVSCSPYRVPIARLAAAQASIMHQKEELSEDEQNKTASLMVA